MSHRIPTGRIVNVLSFSFLCSIHLRCNFLVKNKQISFFLFNLLQKVIHSFKSLFECNHFIPWKPMFSFLSFSKYIKFQNSSNFLSDPISIRPHQILQLFSYPFLYLHQAVHILCSLCWPFYVSNSS